MILLPSATDVNGDSAINTGIFNLSFNNSINPQICEEPPVKTIPFSTISADISGGDSSNTLIIEIIISFILL